MNQDKIISIIEALANGVDPLTGEVLPDTSPYNHPEIIRALFQVTKLIPKVKKTKKTIEQKQQDNIDKELPKNFGLAWGENEIEAVIAKFKSDITIESIAVEQARKPSSIIGLLKKHGVITEEQAFTLSQKV